MKLQRKQRQPAFGRSHVAAIAAGLCLLLPFLVRLPRGAGWAFQYLWSEGNSLGGNIGSILFFGAFACLPAIVVAGAVLLSKPRFYLPGVFASLTAFYCLGLWHYDNDLGSDAQAALSLLFIPIYTAIYALLAGLAGLIIQEVIQRMGMRLPRDHAE